MIPIGEVAHDPDITPSDQPASMAIENTSPSHSEIAQDDANVDQATRIRRARLAAGLTQAQLARRLGVRQSAVSQWENGRVSPELETRVKLAAILRMPLSDVLPLAGEVPEDAFRDPEVLQLVGSFVTLPRALRPAIVLFLRDLAERHRR